MPYEADLEVSASSPTQENPMFDVLQGFQSSMEKQLGQVSEHLKYINERMSALETKQASLEAKFSSSSVDTPTRQPFKRSRVTPPNLQVCAIKFYSYIPYLQ